MSIHALKVIQYVQNSSIRHLRVNVSECFDEALALALNDLKYTDGKPVAHPLASRFIKLFWGYRNKDIYNLTWIERQRLDDTLLELREMFSRPLCKKAFHNAMRGNKRNHESLAQYLDSLFDHHAKLLIVRLDIHYAESISNDITFDKAVKDRADYINAVKRKYNHLLGYIWKMECGRKRGIHHHLIFIFNGHKVQGDITLCRQLGEDWKSMSDEPRTYYNCNADKRKYKEWKSYGIGTVTYNDSDKRYVLKDKVISYLTKSDEEMLALTPLGCRVVGKSQLPATKQSGGRRRAS
ncbi:inovirus-type Gp2 protein [Plesiomonas sp. ZOR0011]|uniref:YagK/YfjJ domain-containing protein n=1 Tax=Plesiomonas sp. ZOR0011 TaxID=1339230 RepID=UPI00068C7A2C|nr:inovirus-type Gp2 protein [Plesiomonas sp. ZOR0011]